MTSASCRRRAQLAAELALCPRGRLATPRVHRGDRVHSAASPFASAQSDRRARGRGRRPDDRPVATSSRERPIDSCRRQGHGPRQHQFGAPRRRDLRRRRRARQGHDQLAGLARFTFTVIDRRRRIRRTVRRGPAEVHIRASARPCRPVSLLTPVSLPGNLTSASLRLHPGNRWVEIETTSTTRRRARTRSRSSIRGRSTTCSARPCRHGTSLSCRGQLRCSAASRSVRPRVAASTSSGRSGQLRDRGGFPGFTGLASISREPRRWRVVRPHDPEVARHYFHSYSASYPRRTHAGTRCCCVPYAGVAAFYMYGPRPVHRTSSTVHVAFVVGAAMCRRCEHDLTSCRDPPARSAAASSTADGRPCEGERDVLDAKDHPINQIEPTTGCVPREAPAGRTATRARRIG